MRRREKIYCGNNQILPEGYDRFGLPFECLRKGYGACLYAGRLGAGIGNSIIRRTLFQPPNGLSFILVIAMMILLVLVVILCVIVWK